MLVSSFHWITRRQRRRCWKWAWKFPHAGLFRSMPWPLLPQAPGGRDQRMHLWNRLKNILWPQCLPWTMGHRKTPSKTLLSIAGGETRNSGGITTTFSLCVRSRWWPQFTDSVWCSWSWGWAIVSEILMGSCSREGCTTLQGRPILHHLFPLITGGFGSVHQGAHYLML